jgi:hypothetical protein
MVVSHSFGRTPMMHHNSFLREDHFMKKYLFFYLALVGIAGLGIYAIADDPAAGKVKPPAATPPVASESPVEDYGDEPTPELVIDETSVSAGEKYNELDPAFTRYVDLSLLEQAIKQADAALLTDVALCLAEAERILVRNHKSELTSDKLIARAIKLAIQAGDKETQTRIAHAATALKKPKWGELAKTATEFGSKSRAPAPEIPLDAIDSTTVELTQAVQKACGVALLTGDKRGLEDLQKYIRESPLEEKIKTYLVDLMSNCLKGLPDKAEADDEIIAEFAAQSRATNKGEVQASVRNGWVVAWGKEINHFEYAKLVAAMATGTVGVYLNDLVRESAQTLGTDIVIKAIKNKGQTFGAGKFRVQAGIATYNHWTTEKVPKVVWQGIKSRTEWREVKVPRPNTHQPYVRWRRA